MQLHRRHAQGNRRQRRSGKFLVPLAAGLLVVVVIGVIYGLRSAGVPRSASNPPAPTNTLRGHPIASLESLKTNASRQTRPRRTRPGSYPKRMMNSQLKLLGEGRDPSGLDTNNLPSGMVLTNLPAPTVEGYQSVSFHLLSGYDFEVSEETVGPGSRRGLEQVPPEVMALNGQEVALRGFLLPIRMDEGRAVEFLLMRDQTFCCFGGVPLINHWVSVDATDQPSEPNMDIPVTVCGKLQIGEMREDGMLVGLYKMKADKVTLEK